MTGFERITFILSPEDATDKLQNIGIPKEVWEHHIATNGLNHWARTYMHIATGDEPQDIFEVFTELNQGEPLLQRRIDEMRNHLETRSYE